MSFIATYRSGAMQRSIFNQMGLHVMNFIFSRVFSNNVDIYHLKLTRISSIITIGLGCGDISGTMVDGLYAQEDISLRHTALNTRHHLNMMNQRRYSNIKFSSYI